jgi:hypothetical protein
VKYLNVEAKFREVILMVEGLNEYKYNTNKSRFKDLERMLADIEELTKHINEEMNK